MRVPSPFEVLNTLEEIPFQQATPLYTGDWNDLDASTKKQRQHTCFKTTLQTLLDANVITMATKKESPGKFTYYIYKRYPGAVPRMAQERIEKLEMKGL